jgi:hypothetical protein
MDEIPLYEDVRSKFFLNSSKAFTYVATAALIWIIFFLIYIPTSVGVTIIGYFNATQIISLIALLGILMLLYRAFHYYVATCNTLGIMITLARLHDKTYDGFQNYSEIVIYAFYILSVIIAYIFLWPLISVAIGTLNGVVLTIVIFWILWMIVKIVMRFDRIEKLKVERGS